MSAPDPEGMSLLAKVLAAAAAVLTPPWLFWKWLNDRLERKADKHSVANQFQVVTNELAMHKQTMGKLFDQIRENEQRAADRHSELLREIAKKADRRERDR